MAQVSVRVNRGLFPPLQPRNRCGSRIPGLGRLPGDIVYRKGNFTFYFPLVTCLLLSVILSLLLSLFRR